MNRVDTEKFGYEMGGVLVYALLVWLAIRFWGWSRIEALTGAIVLLLIRVSSDLRYSSGKDVK